MTYNQPPMGQGGYQPQYYSPGQYAAPNPRPASVTTLAIIGIVLGGLGVLCCGWGVIGSVINTGANNAAFGGQPYQPTAGQNAWGVINSVINFLLSVALLVGSIGSLMLARWSRLLMLGYAIASIAMAVVMLAMTFAVVMPAMEGAFRQMSTGNAAFDAESFGRTVMILSALLVFLVMTVFPVFILIYYRRPNVVAAFEGSAGY